MAIHFTTAVEGDLLLVRSAGFDESLAQTEQYGAALIQECLAKGIRRVLCDERELEYRLSTIDTFELAAFLADQARGLARVAIVCSEKCVADAKFWETVAVNRMLSVRVFRDPADARAWLDAASA